LLGDAACWHCVLREKLHARCRSRARLRELHQPSQRKWRPCPGVLRQRNGYERFLCARKLVGQMPQGRYEQYQSPALLRRKIRGASARARFSGLETRLFLYFRYSKDTLFSRRDSRKDSEMCQPGQCKCKNRRELAVEG